MQATDTTASTCHNPFAMLLDPLQVSQAVERSERLKQLRSRICRPLDKPVSPRGKAGTSEFAHAVDTQSHVSNK